MVSGMFLLQRTITADLLDKALGGKMKTIFATTNEEDGSVTAQNVEAVARLYYIEKLGYTEGRNDITCGLLWEEL